MEQYMYRTPSLGQSDEPPDRSEIDQLLKKKRKARELKACYPCRQRKVKCSGDLPCEGCLQRQHPEICMMLGPEKRRQHGYGT